MEKDESVKTLVDKSFDCEFLRGHWYHLVDKKITSRNIRQVAIEIDLHQKDREFSVRGFYIHLQQNQIGSLGCFYLAKGNWNKLSILDLASNKIGDKGCEYLIRACWKGLRTLHLEDNEITSKGCHHLSHGQWPQMRNIFLHHNRVDKLAINALKQLKWAVYWDSKEMKMII